MSKRELETLAQAAVDVDAPRTKRRRETPADDPKPGPSKGTKTIPSGKEETEQEREARMQVVKAQAGQLWQTVKDATAADGRSLSFDFYHLPSRRKYVNYYEIIKNPIALDQIKERIDAGSYHTVRAAKEDMELCFRNAKRYNLRESQIFIDAKALHKLTKRTFTAITGEKAKGDHAEDDDADDDGEPKKKPPNMHKILTKRLSKLCEIKDESGYVLSTAFMTLPDRKQWAVYYKAIAKPMCFEKIYKHLQRKEYKDSAAFAADVELIIDNALAFNEDHSPVWEWAQALRIHFRKLMADLPPPYALAQYQLAQPTNGKLKLRIPAPHPMVPATAAQATTATSTPAPAIAAAGEPSLPVMKLSTSRKEASALQSGSSALPLNTPPATSLPSKPAPTKAAQEKSPAKATPAKATPAKATPAKATPAKATLAKATPPKSPSGKAPSTAKKAPAAPVPMPSTLPVPTPPVPTPASTLLPASVTTPTPAAVPATPAVNSYYSSAVYNYGNTSTPTPTQPQISSVISSLHYPHAHYVQPALKPTTPAPAPSVAIPPPAPTATTTIVHSSSSSPAPQPAAHTLQSATLTLKPSGRRLQLDARDGVRTWALRLATGEHGVCVGDVTWLTPAGDEDEESSDADSGGESDVEMAETPTVTPRKRGRRRGRGRGRGRGGASAVAANAVRIKDGVKLPPKRLPPQTTVKLDKNEIALVHDRDEEQWEMTLQPGPHVVEVGERGQRGWKVYVVAPTA